MFSQLHNQHHQHSGAVSPRGHAGGVDPRSEDLHHVALGVYIGSHYVLKSAQPLLKRGIRTVVNAAIEFVTESPELINWDDLQRNGIEVHNAMLDDTLAQPIFPSASLEAAVKKIDEVVRAGNSVLVNCAMGMTYDQALAACKRARPLCQPNANFERQLRQLEASLRSALPAAASPPASPASPLHSPLHRQTSFTSPHSPSHSAPHSPHFPSANSFTGLSSPLGNSTAGNSFGHGFGSFRGGAGDFGSGTVSRNPYSTNNSNFPPQSPPRNSPASPPRSPFAHPPVSPRAAPSPGYGGASSLRGPASPLAPTVTGAGGVGSPGLGGLGSGFGGGYGGYGNAGGHGSPYGSLYNNNNYRGAGSLDLGSLGMRRLSL